MARAHLTQEAQNGWTARCARRVGELDNSHMPTSPAWYAYEAGAAMAARGFTMPVKAWKGRGYSVNVETVATRFAVTFDRDNAPTVTRQD